MEEAILNSIRQRSEFIRYVELLCREIVRSPSGDTFKKLVSKFFLCCVNSAERISESLDVADSLGSFDKIKTYLIGYFGGRVKKETFKNLFIQFMQDHKNSGDGLSNRALRLFMIFADLFDDKGLLKDLNDRYSDIIQKDELLKDYISVILEQKRTDLVFENWGNSRFDLDDLIKSRLLFLGGVKIKEKRAFYLREHYRIVTNFFEKFNIFEVGRDVTGDSLFKIVTYALVLRKIGYDEGIFLPSVERINYLKGIVGEESLSEIILQKVKENFFVLKIPVLEDMVSKWLPVSLKSFFIRWPVLCILMWGATFKFLAALDFFDKYKFLKLYVSLLFVGLFIGGFLVFLLFRQNLSKIGRNN